VITKKWKYFTLDEFKCGCGCDRHELKMSKDFINLLDNVRDDISEPIRITSGYRCPTYNISIGGAKKSAHVEGLAADIWVPDNYFRFILVNALIRRGINRIGIGSDFVHADMSRKNSMFRMWVY